jgi:hypothetical protein
VSDAENSLIMEGDGLTLEEAAKLKRLDGRLWAMFIGAGHDDVRFCRISEAGGQRMIGFAPTLLGRYLVAITAADFLAASDDEVLDALKEILDI